MAKTGCREVIEAFEEFLNAPETRRSEIVGVHDHFRACPACRGRASHLVRLLAAEIADEDVLTCEECQGVLPGYLAAESLGESDGPEWVHVRRHLEACPHCAAAQTSLIGLFSLADGESGAEPPSYPRPDLSFLPGVQSGLWKQTAEGLHRLAATIPVLIDRAGASFGVLAAPLTVQLAPIPVYRDKRPRAPAEEARDFLELLALPHPEANLMLKVSLGPVFEDRGVLALAAGTIDPPQPIAQARVTLRDADGTLLEGASTGADGVVLFRDLDIGEYLIRVEYAEKAWEFPLLFASA